MHKCELSVSKLHFYVHQTMSHPKFHMAYRSNAQSESSQNAGSFCRRKQSFAAKLVGFEKNDLWSRAGVSHRFEKKDSHQNRDLRALGSGEIIGEANLGLRKLFLENAAGASTHRCYCTWPTESGDRSMLGILMRGGSISPWSRKGKIKNTYTNGQLNSSQPFLLLGH